MSGNLKRVGSPLGDEDEDEEEDDYQIFTQADPVKKCSSSSEASQEEEPEPFVCSQLKSGSGSQIGVKLSRVKKKRKDIGPGDYLLLISFDFC